MELNIEAIKLISDFAAWSRKYPRSGIYSTNSSMDKELIELEERAKELDILFKSKTPLNDN